MAAEPSKSTEAKKDLLTRPIRGFCALQAHRTLEDPGEIEIVELLDHQITSMQRPHVDVTFDGQKVAEVAAEAALEIDLRAVTSVVADGRLSVLRSDRADIDARLSIEGIRVAEATRQIELSIEVALGDGIPLVERAGTVIVLPDPEA